MRPRAILKREKTLREVWGVDYLYHKALVDIAGSYEWIEYKTLSLPTGLVDVNGKDVFEGDIVACFPGKCLHQIIWIKELGGKFWGGMPGWYLSDIDEGYAWTGNEEIIGNLYENPELLKDCQ